LDRAAGQAEGERPARVRPAPVLDVLQVGEQHALLDVVLEVLPLELALQHLLRAQLLDAQVAGGAATVHLLADHFHSSAPLLQTYTNATISSATNVTVSTTATAPKAFAWMATGYRKTTRWSKRIK